MRRVKLILLIMSLAAINYALATTMLYLTTENMALQSDDILRAKAVKIESRFNDEKTQIYTYTTLKPIEWVKDGGAKPQEVVVRQIGGTAEGIVQTIAGNAHFEEGEEVFVFLKHKSVENNEGFYFLLAMSQTKYTVHLDKTLGEPVLSRDLGHINLINFNKRGEMETTLPLQVVKPLKYKDFVSEIRRIIQQNAAP